MERPPPAALVRALTRPATAALERAVGEAVALRHYEVTTEHYLLALLEQPGTDVAALLAASAAIRDPLAAALQRGLAAQRTGNQGRPTFSPALLDWLADSMATDPMSAAGPTIRSAALLVAFVARPRRYMLLELGDLVPALAAVLPPLAASIAGSQEEAPVPPPSRTLTIADVARAFPRPESWHPESPLPVAVTISTSGFATTTSFVISTAGVELATIRRVVIDGAPLVAALRARPHTEAEIRAAGWLVVLDRRVRAAAVTPLLEELRAIRVPHLSREDVEARAGMDGGWTTVRAPWAGWQEERRWWESGPREWAALTDWARTAKAVCAALVEA